MGWYINKISVKVGWWDKVGTVPPNVDMRLNLQWRIQVMAQRPHPTGHFGFPFQLRDTINIATTAKFLVDATGVKQNFCLMQITASEHEKCHTMSGGGGGGGHAPKPPEV